jgi:antitoxin component YwqK of YwqJK toxin-antitoxin module
MLTMDIFRIPTTKYYANGQLKFESRHEDGLIVVKEWYPNGAKLRECFRDPKTLWFVGMRKEYDYNGNIEIEIPYSNDGTGKLQGVQRGFYPNGRVAYEMHYEYGNLVKQVQYSEDSEFR